jgi:hypothetical protein
VLPEGERKINQNRTSENPIIFDSIAHVRPINERDVFFFVRYEMLNMTYSILNTIYASRNTRFDQSKITNYAKQSQFPKKSNVYNLSENNELQRKTNCGHLVKTNPIKAKFKS